MSAIQLLAALSLCALALYLLQVGVDPKWVTIGGLTLLGFGFLGYRTKPLWKNPWYWVTVLAALVVHVSGVLVLQRNRPALPGLYYTVLAVIELTALYAVVLKLFG